jgi:CHAD domain-containing protein
MDTRTETEAKYTIPDNETFEKLTGLRRIKRYSRRQGGAARVHDLYLDTDDHRFYGRQYFVRVRQKVNEAGAEDKPMLLTIKRLGGPTEGAIHRRAEYEAQVPGFDISEWPQGEARALAEEIAGDEPLRDLVTVDQVRHISTLRDGERVVAEMSLDEISTETGHGPVEAYELEIELRPDGTLADLQEICKSLAERYKLKAQPLSKFERALQLGADSEPEQSVAIEEVSEGPPASAMESSEPEAQEEAEAPVKKSYPPIEPADNIAAASRKMLSRYADSMLANEEGTIEGKDPEALHDMRVATRRIRAALRLLGPYISSGRTEKLSRGVRAVTRALGGVRDLDVLLEDARRFQGTLPEEQRTDLDGLVAGWEKARKGLRKRLVRALKSSDYRRFKRQMGRYLKRDNEQTGDDPMQPHQVRHVAGSAIWARYEEVRAAETVMDSPTIEQLHALRIHGKYLRYTLESFRDALPSEAAGLIKDVVAMQDHLGAMHDADLASDLIRAYIATHQSKKKRKNAEEAVPSGLTAYLDEREAAVHSLAGSFGDLWGRINSTKWRSRLAGVVAAL